VRSKQCSNTTKTKKKKRKEKRRKEKKKAFLGLVEKNKAKKPMPANQLLSRRGKPNKHKALPASS
jgi:hypothetical protein